MAQSASTTVRTAPSSSSPTSRAPMSDSPGEPTGAQRPIAGQLPALVHLPGGRTASLRPLEFSRRSVRTLNSKRHLGSRNLLGVSHRTVTPTGLARGRSGRLPSKDDERDAAGRVPAVSYTHL